MMLSRTSPQLRWSPAFQRITMAGQPGMTSTLSNVSPVSADFEQVIIATALLPDDSLLYVVTVALEQDAGAYRTAFTRVLDSIQIVQ